MVICATTSAALSRRLATPPCWRVTSDPPTRDREECHAGARPNSSAAADVTTIANPSSRASVAAARGMREPSGEINRNTPSRSHEAHTIPIAPPSCSQDKALREQLPDETSAAHPQRDAKIDLSPPRLRPGEQ